MSILSQSILGGQPDILSNPLDQYDPTSVYAGYLGYAANAPQVQTYDPFRNPQVNYADPAPGYAGPLAGAPSSLLQLDPDPFGTRTASWAQSNGVELQDGEVMSLDVFGRRMSRDQLLQSDSGKRLLEIAERRRKGQKRGFLDAIMDWSWEDAPFVSLLATVGKSLSDAATVSDTFKKLQNGLPVSDEDLLKTRLYMAEAEERENGTWGATVGDIVRAAPGFVAEFFATGGAYSLARAGLSKAGKAGIHLGMTRATKILAREAMQEAAERQVAKGAAKGAAGFVTLAADDAAKKGVIDEVAGKILTHTMKGNPLYKGLGDDALKELARSRAEYEFGKMVARNAGGKVANGLNTFSQWLGQNVSRGLMDFGAWGTEESTVLFTGRSKATRALADAVGTFLVDAPLKGAMIWAPNQFVARPVVEAVAGGRTVSSAQLGLEMSAYMTGNRELMANAESMAHGLSLLEYVSENTGRGLTSLLRAAGMGLEKAGVRGIVRPATKALGIAEDTTDAVSLGGRMRQWVETVFGSRKDYLRKTTQDKVKAVASKLGVSGDADMRAIETAVMSNSVASLRPELASRVGQDVGKFAMQAVKDLTDKERLDFQYKTLGKFMVADWMARHQVGPETVMNMFDRLGYDGVLGEMFEERYSDFAKGLFGWDDRTDHDLWSNVKTAIKNLYPGWDQLTAEAVAFAMPMVLRAGILRVQSAVSGGEGTVRDVRTRLDGIRDAMRVGTVGSMTPGEYLANHERMSRADEERLSGLAAERERQQTAVDDAVKRAVDMRVAGAQEGIAARAEESASRARQDALARGASRSEADEAANSRREWYIRTRTEAVREKFTDEETARLNAPGAAGEALTQLDADIARARKVADRRRELHEKFWASVPDAAENTVAEIAVPLYTDDDLADDARFNRTPLITAQQANDVLSAHNAMVDYAPELSRRLVEMESRIEGEDTSWWRRAAHRLVGVAGALATGDFSLAAANPAQWTARDMGLTQNLVDGLKKNMRDYAKRASDLLGAKGATTVEAVARLRAEAARVRNEPAYRGEALADELERHAAAMASQGENAVRPTQRDVMDLAERLAAPAARRIMSANLAAHQLRTFSKTRVRDQALGIVAKELGYEWYSDRDTGALRFYKYGADGKVDESTAMDAETFAAANRERVDETAKGITSAAVDLLTRRLTKAGDESVRLMNAVTMPDSGELRNMAQARLPGGVGPVAQDAVMREAALYDAAMRMVGEGDIVERVRIDGTTPLSETLDRGALGRINMATVDHIARFDKAEDADPRAFDALAWSLNLPFDGTEKGLAERNGKLFRMAKLATQLSRPDRAYYSKPTPIDDEDASRMSPNGNVPLTATLVNGVWVADYGDASDGTPRFREFATREAMDEELRSQGYQPDQARLVLTLARVVESSDMFHMIRELGLGYAYRSALRGGNVHPMLRKAEDGSYLEEDVAQRVLREELAASEGGDHAPEGSPARVSWEKVWGENGYMRVGERLLEDCGVEKSVVSKYAGEFSDWSPAVYTLKLGAGWLSPTSANVYVPVDPLVNPDVESGVIGGVLIQAFLSHPRLLMGRMSGTISEFAGQVNVVIDRHVEAAKDRQLVSDLEKFRRAVVSEIDRAVKGADGSYEIRKGTGLTAGAFATMVSAFVLGRESDYAASPHLRACAEIASDVRMCPAFADFCNLADVVLGGNGFIDEAARVAAGAEARPESARGLARMMAYASSDPGAFAEKVGEMRPLGLEPREFLDLCLRRLSSMVKGGVSVVQPKEVETLRTEAEAASGEKPEPKAHWTFYGHLIAVVQRALGTDLPASESARDFLKGLAETAQDEPGVTAKQKNALRQMLGILTRTRVVRDVAQTYVKVFNESNDLARQVELAKKARDEAGRSLSRAKKRGEAETDPRVLADRQRVFDETKALWRRLHDEYSRSLKEVRDAESQVRATMNAGEAEAIIAEPPPAQTGTPSDSVGPTGSVNDARQDDFGVPPTEDADNDADNDDMSVGGTDAMELPESAALGKDKTVMSHGFSEVPVEMEMSVQRLAVNVCVRAVAMSARPGPDADPLEPVVTEDSVAAMAKKLFHLSDREVDAIRDQYRLADDLRMQANRTWDDYARPGARWEFQEDDKADDDVSSDYYLNRAAAEYNSPFLADVLALAARVAPESGTNLRAFVARTKEWMRRSVELKRTTPAIDFALSVLDPRLDSRGKTQAEQSALHMRALSLFDEEPETVAAHVEAMLAPDEDGKFPTSRRLAFLLSYMASLPVEDRRNFALLCANSVSAQAMSVESEYGEDGVRRNVVKERRVGAGDKISDHIVADTFVHVLGGKDASEARAVADALRAAQADVLRTYPRGGAKVAGAILARVFGRESPLVTALASDTAAKYRERSVGENVNKVLRESVTPVNGQIPVVESVIAQLEALAAKGEPLTSDNVTAAFVALFETGRPGDRGVLHPSSGPSVPDPLKAWISTYGMSLPATILSADVDQRRESRGSSVPIAPRDSIPMVSRWIYSDEPMRGFVDGRLVTFPTFAELARKAFPGRTETEYERCRQDACWPDGTPVCAKNTSTSLTTRELFLACENAYNEHLGDAWYIPLYAGDHSSSTMLRIPWSVKMDGFMKAAQAPVDRTDLVRVSFPEGNSHKGKDEKKFNQLGGLTKFIGFGTGSTGLYAKALVAIANKETYTENDIVGVSVNGKRPGRVPVRGTDVERLVRAAAQAGATIIADEEKNRTDYNLGERELAELLRELGYSDTNGNGVWRPIASPAGDESKYRRDARAMSYAVGMNLMYTDTKRSAITSLENQGAGLIGAEVQDDGTVRYGEHRVHILHNWAFERPDFAFKKANKNEALLGTTRMYGYGARTMKTLSKDRRSDLLKMHLISTSGRDLFFIKSLSVAVPEYENEGFLDGSMNGVIDSYARDFRGNDRSSTDTYTDDDSYKIGVGNSKAILVDDGSGKPRKLMQWLFSKLRDLCGAPKDASEDEVAKAFKSAYGKLTGDKLDELVGTVPIVDLARTDGKPVGMRLSELMPGVMVNAVEGLDGPCLDLSYREDGAMAYTVANVSHSSTVSGKPGRTPRNYEMDMIAAATMLGKGEGASLDPKFQDAFELVANWGLVAACVYATRPQRDAAAARSAAVENLRTNGEHPDGQNIRSEVARAVWATVRENANLPVKGVDAALVACGASIDDNNRLVAHTKSEMHKAFMRGAEIFTADEQAFFGRKFRHALCNVNLATPGFRYAWFLNRQAFDAGDDRRKSMTDRDVAKELERMFVRAYKLARDAHDAKGDTKKAAEAEALEAKKDIARLFVDHHGLPIWSDDPAKSGYTERYVRQFSLSDLFDRDGRFDLTALQLDGDRVHNDATGLKHILLGGTRFGFPRTPSYNAHYETVRAGLPVTERKYVDSSGQDRWRVGRDAMVSPDPYTNKVLGTDHDGDKSKLYLLHTDKYGLADEADPAALAPSDGLTVDALKKNETVEIDGPESSKIRWLARDLYTKRLCDNRWLEEVWTNPETGEEEPVPNGERPEGRYLRVSERAKMRVSNAFVRTMFTISDSVPTLDMDGNERVSTSASDRIKCLGGIAFRPVSTQPVLTETAWDEITKNAMPPVLGPGETIGDPWLAAQVSTSAEDADGARGTVVSLARTLHVAYASGMFVDLFGGRQPKGMEWLAFLNHFDGLSNATFDDIKEQICGRLGWTKGMMDTVVVGLLSSVRDGIPTEDAQWAKILGDYAKNVRDGKAEYWMLKASSVEEDEFVEKCRDIVGAERLSKEAMHAAMGAEFDEETKHWRPTGNGTAPLAGVMSSLYDLCETDAERAGFDYIVTSANGKLGHNSTLGRLAYLVSDGRTLGDLSDTVAWATKRAQLAKAQKFERAVNYLTADPGDASKFAKYGAEDDEDTGDPTVSAVVGGGYAGDVFRRMEAATMMMYRAAGNLATVEASAVLAAVRRDENLERLAEDHPEAAAYLFVKDALPQWDRMGLAANRQQLPYLMSFFLRQANVASRLKDVDGNWLTPLHDGAQLYGAVRAMAARVAGMRIDDDGNTLAIGKGLAARVAIESLFSIMYRLMTSSSEYADGATLPSYLRAPADTNFKEKDYGKVGTRLRRIMPGYRSNDHEAHERVRGMYEDVLAGRAYAGTRKAGWTNPDGSRGDAVCREFFLARGERKGKGKDAALSPTLRRYLAELIPPEDKEFRREFLANTDLKLADLKARYPRQMDVWNEAEVAAYALWGLEEFLGAGKGQVAVTPAMMFGQLLPLYSLMTSRCLGAPDPSSPSILALAPAWMYEEISAGEAELTARAPELVDSVVAGNWAPYLENVRRTGKAKRWDPKAKELKEVSVAVKDVDALAATKLAPPDDTGPHPAQVPDAVEAAEQRRNPEWRTTVDIFSDGALEAALKAAGPSTARAVPASAPAPGPAPKGKGAYDEKVARVAGALGLAFGSWATVEYAGGKTFTVSGRLRGTVGQGKRVVFTVDMDGKMCDSDRQVQALADSEAYGASLAECCPGLGLRSGRDFLLLKRDVRVALARRYGVGGATDHHVQWKFDGKGVATLVGAIHLGSSKADTTVFHEYFHEMMRVFDAVGLFSEADKEALRKTFGEPARKNQWFNEERAAEAFRKWAEKRMEPESGEARSLFRKIYDTLKGILLAIRRGFGYTDDSEKNMELLFGFVAHGVAQASESRVAELKAGAARASSIARQAGAQQAADRLADAADSLDAAYLARNDVAVATAIAQIVPPPRIENAKMSTADLAGVESRAERRKEEDMRPVAMADDFLDYGLESTTEYDSVDQLLRVESDNRSRELVAMLGDPSTPAAAIEEAMLGMVEVRRRIAEAMGRGLPETGESNGPVSTDTGTEGLHFAPGSAEAAIEETREAVRTVTTPMAEVNDFYRAANFIYEALERELSDSGSWKAPLADITRRYSARRGDGVDENRDKAAVLHGLRNALESIRPGASAVLDDRKLENSLAFEAALRMYHGLDSWAREKTRAPGSSPLPTEAGSDERSAEASQYDVAGWILSSRPLSASATLRSALDRTQAFLDRRQTPPVAAELVRHRDALRDVLAALGDGTGLTRFRDGKLREMFDKAFAALREGTRLDGHSQDGRLRDILPNLDKESEYREKGMTRALSRMTSFASVFEVPAVQESLKSALEALWQAQAQEKFYRETDVVPSTVEDIEESARMAARHGAPHETDAEWADKHAVGNSNLVDDRALVDFYCKPAFIAENVDAWLQSLVRKSFGARDNIGEMLSAENREFGALKMRIADLENFYSLLMGTNVEDGGYLLKVEQVRGKWKQRWGEVVREDGGTYLKIDNYRRKPTKIQLTEADLRVIDLYLKSVTAYAKGQDRVVTGMDRLWFSAADLEHDWSREAIAAKWNGGSPAGHLTPMEDILRRLDEQFPEDVLGGTVDLRGRLTSVAEAALSAAKRRADDAGEPLDPVELNKAVLRALRKEGLVATRADNSLAVVTIPTDALNRMFLGSGAYRKLTSEEGGRKTEWLSRDKIRDDYMAVWRDAVRFVRKHPWLVHGDGRYFHNFGTTLPFWRGGGVFMYNCARSERDAPKAAAAKARTAAAKALYRTMGEEDVDEPLSKLDFAAYSELLDRTGEAYAVANPGVRLAEDVKAGLYEEGEDLAERTGLVLPKDATKADLARALYRKALEDVHGMALGSDATGLRDANEVIEAYEGSALERGEIFGNTFGMNDLDVYRLHGKLPANAQIGHAVHIAIDGVTNAMMSRATLANLLTTPAGDGAPVYYADPSEYAAETGGLPDAFWADVARWWAEWNKLEYDAKLTGVQNAKKLYEKISASRDANKGKIGADENAKTYTELSGDDARDCATVDRWLVRDDDRTFEESSAVNSLAGGEAMGYLKQFVQAGRTLGFGGARTRATLHRALSWSKSMSVAFSFFFPLATKWESPIGAVGATATVMSNLRHVGNFLREHPELANMMQKAVGGKGWITQNFLGFQDIIEMMDTNDPFLAEMKAWANALGVTLSTSLVNPMEETKGLMTADLNWLKERVRDKMGSKAAAKFGRIVEAVITRGGDKAFNYALNATKLAVVAQMCMKLRHQARARGKAFDPVRDLRRYRRYINAEVGGIDPLQYAWATPLNRGIMNTLMFSWQWTRGAWEAGGGGIVEDLLLGGHTMTREEREYAVGRWVRMFGTVMIGVPAMMQCVVMALAKALGGGEDDGDHWATWNNEDKTRWTAFDLTPLLRAIERADSTHLGGFLRRLKQEGGPAGAVLGAGAGAFLGRLNGGNAFTSLLGGALGAAGGAAVPALVPLYTGEDEANRTSRARRYYMHFGKQGWEFFRWFEDAKGQFFSKLSMPTQRILEGIMGRNLSYLDRALPWDEMGQFERWLSPTTDGALFNLAQAFLPFSLGGVSRTGDAGFLPIVGPVQMGASQTNVQDRLVKALTAWARNDRAGYRYGGASRTKAAKLLAERVGDILDDAKANGLDPESQLNKAYGQVATKLYGELIDLIPDDPKGTFDARAVERTARAINRVGARKAQVLKSLKTRVEARLKARGLSWKDLPAEERARYARSVEAGIGNPFGTYDY